MTDFNQFIYGGDYNPNQWSKDIWQEDMQLFKKAHINSATINVFSWSKIQPSENSYNFKELDEIIQLLSDENYFIILATSTGALPAWMYKRYPEVARVDYEGRLHKFGQRHNACPNSLVYQKFAKRLVKKLAERYGNHPNISCWHVNNEYGGECYCEKCERAFQVWVKDKYKTIDSVNQAWNMEFWGHTLYDFDEIVAPNRLSEGIGTDKTAFAGISIDYKRFISDSLLNNFKMEKTAIHKFDTKTPITTNLMGTYKGLDYFKWAKELDIVSWDNYPAYNTPWSMVAMTHDLMRGLKNQPFMLMEQTPSQQNWQAYNSLKKPGQMRAQSYQTIAHGADTIQFFQLRRSVGACEKFHGAVIEHCGHEETRVFKECEQLGAELSQLSEVINSQNSSEVGIVFDWDNYWALEYTSGPNVDLTYVEQIHQYYRYFYEQNISVDMIPVDADFTKYKVVIAPVLYMIKAGMQKALENFVQNGGTLLTTFMSGIVDQSDNVYLGGYPGPLRKLAGIWVEETDALAPEQTNTLQFNDHTESKCSLICDIIHLETASSLANYTSNFYAETPVVTKNNFGQGTVYYVGTQLENHALNKVLEMVTTEKQIQSVINEPTDLEITCRYKENHAYYFIINFKNQLLSLPQRFIGKKDLLTGKLLENDEKMAAYTTYLIKE
ncbi:beta-galactosidase [Melissococcus plutonius]|uniref:Beta-galactosidase n=1 Tax=Melissococcus plutonius TaxID=33970 RepID=A0A2Z5Y060_9ENTE|nr:beta-galactosidase [Melissococcus plutonius]BAL61333.1 beta-galactosidase [Melissococcus plutonius DAT561]MCV2498735.1 beta-galactosidase [Melissococcus plutonius]MCV2501381.1 beta-galactosidase [Melissococcus plutonius]MCV2504985.1 beta-galactosidase [Melissococcus plutonius]MCV2507351.1 beta-galactosidase [Melissococcus plutonius]